VVRYDEFMKTMTESAPDEWRCYDDLGLYVYLNDIRISILSDRPEEEEEFRESWVERFPDRTAYRRRFFLRYNGVVIDTFYTAAVDGWRMYIPYPRRPELTITQQQYRIGRILNIGPYASSFDEYLRRAGITVLSV